MDVSILLLLLVTSAVPNRLAADSVTTFSQLGPGDVIEVAVHSGGCFSDVRYHLVFRGGPPLTVTVRTVSTTWSRVTHEPVDPQEFSTTVSDTNVAALDALLRYYRQPVRGMHCTGWEAGEMTQLRDGVHVATEQFRVGPCGMHERGLLSLYQMVPRLREESDSRR